MTSVVTGISPTTQLAISVDGLSTSAAVLQSEVSTLTTNAQALALVVGSKADETALASTQASLASLNSTVANKANQSYPFPH